MVGQNCSLTKYGAYPFNIDEAEELIRKKNRALILIWEGYYTADTTDAEKECIEDSANEFDGVATPIILYVDTQDAKDDVGGVGATGVTIVGLQEETAGDDEYTEDDIDTGGAGPVYTAGTTLFTRLIGAFVDGVGTEKDNAAEIAITSAAGAAEYMVIAAGQNCTESLTFWIAPGYKARILKLRMANSEAGADGAAANTIVSSVRVSVKQTHGSFNETVKTVFNVDLGQGNYSGQPGIDVADHVRDVIYPVGGVDTVPVKLSIHDETLDDGDHTFVTYRIQILVWKER